MKSLRPRTFCKSRMVAFWLVSVHCIAFRNPEMRPDLEEKCDENSFDESTRPGRVAEQTSTHAQLGLGRFESQSAHWPHWGAQVAECLPPRGPRSWLTIAGAVALAVLAAQPTATACCAAGDRLATVCQARRLAGQLSSALGWLAGWWLCCLGRRDAHDPWAARARAAVGAY